MRTHRTFNWLLDPHDHRGYCRYAFLVVLHFPSIMQLFRSAEASKIEESINEMTNTEATIIDSEDVKDAVKYDLPIDMRFNEGHVVSIITYSILMVVSAVGNLTVLALTKQKKPSRDRSKINVMLMSLAIADLLVTFLMMPLEIGWAVTVSWKAGDIMCRVMAFFRVFGLYLSSFVLVCISMDRYYAVIRPLPPIEGRGRTMLTAAWVGSVICSIPQIYVFHLETHPNVTGYSQCVTFNSFPTYMHELAYYLFGMIMMYCFPLIMITYSYISILLELCRRSKEHENGTIRRSSQRVLSRAKIRTLKMTIIIVAVFFICWSPYYVMSLWYWIDRSSARKVDQRVQKLLFLFACTNSCMNPIVYGVFNIRRRQKATAQPNVTVSEQSKAAHTKRNTTIEIDIEEPNTCRRDMDYEETTV